MAAALISRAGGVAVKETLALVYTVFKVRIGTAIMLTALAGIAVAPGPAPEPWQIVVLALAVLLSSASAGWHLPCCCHRQVPAPSICTWSVTWMYA
jgi:heme O synthase-like polyprenyltransferase